MKVLDWMARHLIYVRCQCTTIHERQEAYHVEVDVTLFPAVVHPDLGQLNCTHSKCVERKHKIISVDRAGAKEWVNGPRNGIY